MRFTLAAIWARLDTTPVPEPPPPTVMSHTPSMRGPVDPAHDPTGRPGLPLTEEAP